MPPLPINLSSLPNAFINAVTENSNEDSVPNDQVKSQQKVLLASSAEKDVIFACVQRIDDKIRGVKAEVLQLIRDRQEEFVALYDESASLRNKIDTLFMEVDSVSRGINDPETGMKPKLLTALKDNKLIKQQVQNTRCVVETLEYLSELQTSEKRFQEYMIQGRIEEAAGTITEMDRLLESPPIQTNQKIHIFDRLKIQLASMRESLERNLDDLLNEAISFKKSGENDADGFNLSIESINMQLSRLKKNAMKYLVNPLLKHRDSWKASVKIEDDITARLFVGPTRGGENIADYNQGDAFSVMILKFCAFFILVTPRNFLSIDVTFTPLIVIFQFVYTFIFGGINPTSKETLVLPIASQYASTFGKFISHDLRDVVINEYLSHVIPTEISEFKRFEEVTNAVRRFQLEMRRMGFMRTPREGEEEEERTLGAYVAKVDILFTVKKRDRLLELGRNIMLNKSFESVFIIKEEPEEVISEETRDTKLIDDKLETENHQNGADVETQNINPNEGWEVDWNEAWDEDGWVNDDSSNQERTPGEAGTNASAKVEKELMKYAVTVKPKPLIDLTINTLDEAQNLNTKSGLRLYQATLDLFDLYRAIMPVYHSDQLINKPALAMLFRNDYSDDSKGDRILYKEAADRLRELGSEWYEKQLDKQKSLHKQILQEMGGVQQSANEERFEACQRSMNRIVDNMNYLSKEWKEILLPSEYYSIMGSLIGMVLDIMIENLEDLYDISAEESHQLNLIYSRLLILENIFNGNRRNTIEQYVKNWKKFCQITDILELSFAEIMNRFRASELECFTTNELEGLICALFADTALRERNLQEIRDGHPVREH
ncbi:5727_t:CDS:10 [Acaulospora colombiana]|uniref:5727_t:CDS:1 n=1 Tax=Acaulospora colombiana TaxID=27376 RepID=A0ACA9L6V6_9GLOM|nr:5727_t:CDS:10 [Acaulospora colombiana]